MDKPRLKILVPVIRPNNIWRIFNECKQADPYFDWSLICILDEDWRRRNYAPPFNIDFEDPRLVRVESDIPGQFGERNLPVGMELVEDDEWVWFLSDDNIPVEGFFEALRTAIDDGASICVFPMDLVGGFLRPRPECMAPGRVDMSQLTARKDMLRGLWWHEGPTPDGNYIANLYARKGDDFTFLEKPVMRYNQLR